MNKSQLDLMVERRVLTEKQTIASIAIDILIQRYQPNQLPFVRELGSNKFVLFIYPDDKNVDVFLVTLLKKSYLHRNVADEFMKCIGKKMSGFAPSFMEDVTHNYVSFAYKATIGGATVLHHILNDTMLNTLTIETLKLEKAILDYGR